jgi:hypothetical protein
VNIRALLTRQNTHTHTHTHTHRTERLEALFRFLRLPTTSTRTMRKNVTAPKAKATPLKSATKCASRTAQTPNGTPKSASARKTPSKTTRSPTAQPQQPAELSEEDRLRLREWLEYTERPFAVHTVPLSKKRKRTGTNQLQLQDDLFEERLSVQYEVKPRDKWESLRRYKKFTGKKSIDHGG